MKLLPNFLGKVEKGVLKVNNKEVFRKILAEFEGKEVEITIKRKENINNASQRRLYWYYLRQISSYTGYDVNELHEKFKNNYLSEEQGGIPGVKSTRNLTIQEFQEYLAKIQREMAEIGVELKDQSVK